MGVHFPETKPSSSYSLLKFVYLTSHAVMPFLSGVPLPKNILDPDP